MCNFFSLEVEDLTVVTASNDGYSGDVYGVEKLIFHPHYDPETMDYQYALIKVTKPFVWKSKVKAINLPTEDLTDTTKMLVSGWGYTSVSGGKYKVLHTLRAEFLDVT